MDMVVWLVTVGEPLPVNGRDVRLLRTGILANELIRQGHLVVWWTSTFDHWAKQHHSDRDASFRMGQLDLRMLRGCGYRRNISFRRIVDHALVARSFARQAESHRAPDVIVCSLPTLELAVAAVHYGHRHQVPVVIDVRDLWPDIFLEQVPRWIRPLAKLAMYPMLCQARRACRGAFAITGNSPGFVEWGLRQAGRLAGPMDRHFPFGYASATLDENERGRALSFWHGFNIVPNGGEFVACFFGSMSHQFDLETVIDAAKLLQAEGRRVRFVLCGTGERLAELKARAANTQAVVFPGWIGRSEIKVLMDMSNVGLAPYVNHIGFARNLPNKPIEYLAGGLPILSSLTGYLQELLEEFGCGDTYKEGDAQSLRDLVVRISDNPKLAIDMGRSARTAFSSRFDAATVYSGMTRYLEEVVVAFNASRDRNA